MGVRVDDTGQDQDAFDQAPDGADAKAEGQQDLGDSLAHITQVEAVDPQAAQENAEQAGGSLDFWPGMYWPFPWFSGAPQLEQKEARSSA